MNGKTGRILEGASVAGEIAIGAPLVVEDINSYMKIRFCLKIC
jgi:hypothetical protein